MSAKAVADDSCNTETEEGTVALQKKRSRRVSFAEITFVHDRDDEYQTPPEPRPNSKNESKEGGLDLADGEESSQNEEKVEANEEEDVLEDGWRSLFWQFESPSPGSTIGSATSNAEDNFFGHVSSSFIRPGRLSDSTSSDENHDIASDSVAFSIHFRCLARSESGGDLKTPTGVHLSFEEKTSTQNTVPANVGSSMVLTVAKPILESSTSVDTLSGSRYSNDMSIVGESPQRYDYGRLPPGLNVLLAEGSKDLHAVSVSDNIPISKSLIKLKNISSPSKKQSGPIESVDGIEKEMGSIDSAELDDANDCCNVSHLGKITSGLSDMRNAPASDVSVDKQCWSPNQLTTYQNSCHLCASEWDFIFVRLTSAKTKDSDALEISRPNSDCDAAICESQSYLDNKAQRTDVFASSGYVTPPAPALSSLSAKQRLIVLNNDSPLQNLQITAPFENQPRSFVRDLTRKQSAVVSSIQKSISKLKMLKASPFSSCLKVNNDSTLMPLDIFKSTVYNTVLYREREMFKWNVWTPNRLFTVATENGELKSSIDLDASDIETAENKVDLSHAKSSLRVVEDGISPGHVSSGFLPKLKEEEGLLITWSGNKMQKNLLTPEDPIEGMVFTSADGCSSIVGEDDDSELLLRANLKWEKKCAIKWQMEHGFDSKKENPEERHGKNLPFLPDLPHIPYDLHENIIKGMPKVTQAVAMCVCKKWYISLKKLQVVEQIENLNDKRLLLLSIADEISPEERVKGHLELSPSVAFTKTVNELIQKHEVFGIFYMSISTIRAKIEECNKEMEECQRLLEQL